MRFKAVVGFVSILSIVGYTGWACWYTQKLRAPDGTPRLEDDFSVSLDRVVPSIRWPRFQKAAEARLRGDAEIIGLCVGDICRAYPLPLLAIVDYHIINDMFGDKPVSVTYCDRSDYVRVLTSPTRGYRIPLDVGGLDEHGQLLVQYGSQRYRQNSPHLPLDEFPFVRTTFSKWLAEHPDTVVLVGGTL